MLRLRSRTVALLFSFVLLCIKASGGTSVQIRPAHANARAEPDSQSDIVAVLDRGEIRPVVSDVPYWYEILLRNGDTAYVAKSLCKVVLQEEGENTDEEAGQPLAELYAVPAPGTPVTTPMCTPTSMSASFTVCPADGTPGGNHAAANIMKNRLARECAFNTISVDDMLKLKELPAEVRELPADDSRSVYLQTLESRPVVLEGHGEKWRARISQLRLKYAHRNSYGNRGH